MAIAFRAYSGNSGAVVTSLAISKPAGVVSGDVMVAIIVSNQTANNTAPSGWTLLDTYSDATNVDCYNSFYKVAGSSEPASYTFTCGNYPAGAIVAYSGVDNTTPINAHNIKFSNTQPFASTALTTTLANCMIVGGFSSESGGSTKTVNSGWTIRGQTNDGINATASLFADQVQAAAGTSTTLTVSGDGGSFSAEYMIALAPSGSPSPSPSPTVSTYTSFFSFY